MAEIIEFPTPDESEISDLVRRLSKRSITRVATVLAYEMETRPELTKVLTTIPGILTDYLPFKEYDKEDLEELRQKYPRYLIGEGDGCGIQLLVAGSQDSLGCRGYNSSRKVVKLAQECRFTHQFLRLFEHYMENQTDKRFNNAYMKSDPTVRKIFRTMGWNLLQNIKKNDIRMSRIVRLAAGTNPDVWDAYEYSHERIKVDVKHIGDYM